MASFSKGQRTREAMRRLLLTQSVNVTHRMQSSEKLCLQWNDFQTNLKSAFQGFRNDQDFADVTLVSEDGIHIETHKVILASSSPFFMEILKKNKHPHPMIYMRGIKADELVVMIDFLYYGEANVKQESLDVFLGLAKELKLKGLTGSSSEGNIEEGLRNKVTAPENNSEERKHHVTTTRDIQNPSNVYNSDTKTESRSVALVSVEADQLEEQIKSMMTMTENEVANGKHMRKAYACNVCGKEGHPANIKTHIESNHIESNITHSCDICGKLYRSRNGLRLHKAMDHYK